MTQEYKETIDRLAVARNHEGGNYLLFTRVPGENKVKVSGKTVQSFELSIIEYLIESLLGDAPSDDDFYAAKELILGKIREFEEQRFQRRIT